jgi:hypothetical protein
MRLQFYILIGSLIVADAARAQLTDAKQKSFVKQVQTVLPISETVANIRNGKVPASTLRVIYTILSNTHEVEIHRMRGATGNKVYVSKDGHHEAVYDARGNSVKDGINDASYNYFHAQKDPLRHLTFDIAPWLLWGQSPNDPTSHRERVHAYAADVFAGVVRARANDSKTDPPGDIDLQEMGTAEALAIFLAAIERGNAQRMLELVDSEEKRSDKQLIEIVTEFEKGMLSLFSSKKGD